MKQTAVEWLINEIKNFDSGRSEYYSKVAIYNHAIRMEKEKIIKSNRDGIDMVVNKENFITGEQYYNETYNK
jgi:hypothetical protein